MVKKAPIVDEAAKEVLYVMSEDIRERPITMVAADMLRKTEVPMSTAIRKIELLIKEGLVEERSQYNRRYVIITDKGKRVAEKLREIDEIMGE